MNRYLQTIKQFRLRSVFFKSYFLFVMVTVLFTSLFSVYIYRIYIKNYSHEQSQMMESFLRQTEDRMDDSLRILTESVRTLSRKSEVVQMVILPGKDTTAMDFQITSMLQEMVNSSQYFDRIILYESTMGNLLQTDDHSEAGFGYGMTPLVQYCLDEENWFLTEVIDHRTHSGFVIYGKELYLAENFISGSKGKNDFLGTLLVRLSPMALFKTLPPMLSQSPYYLTIQGPEERILFQYGDAEDSEAEGSVLERTSSYSGWTFILRKSGDLDLSVLNYVKVVSPFFLIFLLAGLLFSFLLAFRVYRPLHKMLLTFSDTSLEASPDRQVPQIQLADAAESLQNPKSEYELLTNIYQKTRNDQQSAEYFISMAAPEFERNLLMQLIAEDISEPEMVRQQLQYIKSTLCMDDCYQCFLLYSNHTSESSHVENIILQNQAGELAEKCFHKEWGDLRILRLDSMNLLLVVRYASSLSLARIRKYQEQFRANLVPLLLELDHDLVFAGGNVCPSLLAIHQSYSKARETIRKELYYQADEPSSSWQVSSESTDPEGSAGINDRYYQSQIELLDELLQSGSMNRSRNLTAALLREICFSDDGAEAARSRCSSIFNILIRQTIQPEKEDSPMARVYQELETISDQQELYNFMTRETDLLLEKAEVLQNNRQYQLILRVKDYIQQHYSDSTLSLQEIADSFNISNTYLSTLFTEYAGESVVSFLNNYRVEAAKDLLINTKIIIKDIGFRTGFNTVQNFNRVFKKTTGVTPGDFRKQYSSLQET